MSRAKMMHAKYTGVPRTDHEEIDMDNMQVETLPKKQCENLGEPEKNGGKTVCATIRNFALDETTAHGFPHIFRAKSHLGRLLWTVLFLTGVVGTIYQGSVLIMTFFQYPVNVEVKIVTLPELEFPSVTVCNTNKLRLSEIDKSKHRQMLVVDQTTSLPYYAPCLEDDFECKKRKVCIKKYLQCDAIRQCGEDDPSDEQNCDYESRTCTGKQFRCGRSGSSMGMCIPAKMKCNRRKDCYDGEDEDQCRCKRSEFQCKERGGCIMKKRVCNGKYDCSDKSDESDEICGTSDESVHTCNSSSHFRCSSGNQCIPFIFHFDRFRDCRDGSDEDAVPAPFNDDPWLPLPACRSDQFQCSISSSTPCIPVGWTCDESIDCEDGSDESPRLCGRQVCTPPKVPCSLGNGCGTPCDLSPECLESSDEKNCTCKIFRSDNRDVMVQKVTCQGISSEKFIHFPADRNGLYVAVCGTGDNDQTETPDYHCDGILDCYNRDTLLPEPCYSVHSECYIDPYGQDYRGTVSSPSCQPWSHPVLALVNYTGKHYQELEGAEPGSTVEHNFCRNPGGEENEPWCFILSIDTPGQHIPCLGLTPSSTCHSAMFGVSLWHNGSASNASQGRVEVSFGTDAIGTISDPDWTIDDAHVVCRQLGYLYGALNASSDFVPGTGRVLLKDVQCMGIEENLIDCFYSLGTDQDIDHSHDVSVICNDSVLVTKQESDNLPEDMMDPGSEACPSWSSVLTDLHDKSSGCGDGMFYCLSGECIPDWQTCNKFTDCLDGSDEWNAECNEIGTECSPKEFQCKEPNQDGGRKCIRKDFVCDCYNDCGDNRGRLHEGMSRASDEQRCPRPGETPPDNYIQCQDENKFIHDFDVCNTVKDCEQSGDEENCLMSDQDDIYKDLFQHPLWYSPYTAMLDTNDHNLFNSFSSQFRQPPFGRVKSEDPPDWNSFITFSATPDYSDLVDISKLSREEVRKAGHQREDFILQCIYEQNKCRISDFKEFQDDNFGNCYTFNANKSNATKTGSRYGLQMTLFLEQSEYISIYGREAGVRVSINPPHIRPNPTDSGITVKPGAVTSVGLRYNYVLRKGPPYGGCQERITNTKIIADGDIRETSSSELYDRELCKKTCIHQHIRDYCSCSDTLELDGPRCKMLNKTQEVCRQLVFYLSQHNKLNCSESCPQQCSEVYYTKTSSMSTWPSTKFAKHLLRSIHSINTKTRHLNEENIFDNIVRLEVFYEEFNYESTKEVPAYLESSLFGDIGGIVGLYIGFSLITVCEFITLALKLIKGSFCKKPVRI